MKGKSERAARPLWRLLLDQDSEPPLNCVECFSVLEYLAELQKYDPRRAEKLNILLKKHLEICPDCQDYYRQKLAEFEAFQSGRKKRR